MKAWLYATLGFALFLGAFILGFCVPDMEAQTRSPQANSAHPDLMSTLLELDRTAAATNSDIGHLQIDRWKGGWKTGWTTNTHKDQAAHAAVSLQRNLKNALPDLIREAINQHGGMSATFKVYEDLNLVCETLDSLVDTAQQFGKKEESVPLSNDFGALVRLRRTMSSYIQQRAVAADGGGSQPTYTAFTPVTSSSDMQAPRKIIIDDDVQEKKAPKKKKGTIQFNNVE
jgi:hypothetical protein